MAIRRINPNHITRLVSLTDEALAGNSEEIRTKYRETLNPEVLAIPEGSNPTYFLLRPISAAIMVDIQQDHLKFNAEKKTMEIVNGGQMTLKSFRASVIGIEEDGKKIDVVDDDEKKRRIAANKDDNSLTFAEFDFVTVTEIGSYAQTLAMIGDTLKKS